MFPNLVDGTRLAGALTLPEGPGPFPAAVLIAGSGPHDRDLSLGNGRKPFRDLAGRLARRGIASIRYDRRGVGKSSGTYRPMEIGAFTTDALSGAAWLRGREEIDGGRVGYLGISMGGMIAPLAAATDTAAAFAVLLSAPGLWGREFFTLSSIAIARACGFAGGAEAEIRRLYDELWPLYVKPELSGREWNEALRCMEGLSSYMNDETRAAFHQEDAGAYFEFMRSEGVMRHLRHDPAEPLRRLRCPVLALFGDKDVQVAWPENRDAVEAALREGGNEHARVATLEGCDHLLRRSRTGLPSEMLGGKEGFSEEAFVEIADWLASTNGVD